ncbi:hypothetical protein OUZ56_003811 [Daphnia magna]|uniref:RGS domain-containing protein n=1 Tax=Daphnia magna TaxID=35525 RepID=A0ABQ9YMU5_9CRUS|nr:hypothetical protein OUZ56_003811 [Daphnia magna]
MQLSNSLLPVLHSPVQIICLVFFPLQFIQNGINAFETRIHRFRLSASGNRNMLAWTRITSAGPADAQKWAESFTALLSSKHGSSLYHSFLRGEFSNENLEFWLAVEDYKHSTKPKDMAAKAQQIYKDFLTVQASKKQQVNLDAETRAMTLANVQSDSPDQHAFDQAQRKIQHMMERDSYQRFLKSDLFLQVVNAKNWKRLLSFSPSLP